MGAIRLQQLARVRWIYCWLLRFGLTPVGRRLRERAKNLGYELACRPSGLRLRKDGFELWFPVRSAALLWTLLPAMPYLKSRFAFTVNAKGRKVACVSEELNRYRLPMTSDQVWLPMVPEPCDFFSGYLARGRPSAGSVVFDGGAFCGEMTIVLARIVGPSGRIFAFEPDPVNCRMLRRNIEEAGLQNVTVIERGLWRETDELVFETDHQLSSRIVLGQSGGGLRIPVVGFKDACELAGAIPNFVKMDIEGAEVEVIEGAKDFIAGQRIHFSIASYHDRGGRPTSALLEPLFASIGYRVETGFPDHQTTWAWKDA